MIKINNIYKGDSFELINELPDNFVNLTITSPPYSLGKEYEKKVPLDNFLYNYEKFIKNIIRSTKDGGSICWQVGNYINKGEVFPLDIYFYNIFKKYNLTLKNRIIWTFGHGLHCKKRLSGRYETILWFTKSENYTFNLDNIRVPQKYKNKKHYKGDKKGQLSCNPLGKNSSDIWEIVNIKNNHPEKTIHPCQFPQELVRRLILGMSNENDIVFDPFMGVGTTCIVSKTKKRNYIGFENNDKYFQIAKEYKL